MKKIVQFLIPPKEWRLPVIILLGAICGLGMYAMVESKAISYLSDDPKTCANCHVMTPQYATWQNSSHREWASCNDCHVPQDNVFKKYLFKAKDGFYHSSVFTMRGEPEVIRMKEAGVEVVQANCVRCHENQVTDGRLSGMVENHLENRTERKCWTCHQEVPHGKIHSLSSVKYYGKIEAEHQETIPNWIKKYLKNSDNKKDKKDE
ncbi:cytochrome c nitrite reductase small subunit [Lutibacter sp. HS1-25]|uniref:cytochrome c nitrite reductase small subunit n=1 Tax=Lutibacter sp. HS1-25 TaxID=2485000 RepID=UPI00101203F0|nr:cytochrome c nitrite reductase small subunit [Lutibacter sp. HS1-25]RXP49324.1 cytochrome c nitrite reductase small subunit [Lutibacter sp. HS1-25]